MRVLMIGTGNIATQAQEKLKERGFTITASIPLFSRHHLGDFGGCDAIVVIAPESQTSADELQAATKVGIFPFIVTAGNDPLYAWAGSNQYTTYPYPPSQGDYDKLITDLNKVQAGGTDLRADLYRRANLPGQSTALITNATALRRKIVVTSPKGGTGKTTVSVNLAFALAMCGVKTFLVDADANGGSMGFHLRAHKINAGQFHATLMNQIDIAAANLASGATQDDEHGIKKMAEAGELLKVFTEYPELPTLMYLPGVPSKQLGNNNLNNGPAVEKIISGLFEAGATAGGVVIMDVGINPTHPVHRAALRNAEAIAVVIKPEVPDISATKTWLSLMITALVNNYQWSTKDAIEYILPRIKLCYNMVTQSIDETHHVLEEILREELKDTAKDTEVIKKLDLVPNGILPMVPPALAFLSTSSNDAEDIFVRRYKRRGDEELEAFSSALIGFAANFVPPVVEPAASLGLFSQKGKKNALSFFKWKK